MGTGIAVENDAERLIAEATAWLTSGVGARKALAVTFTLKPSVAVEVMDAYERLGTQLELPALQRKKLALEAEKRSGRYCFLTEAVACAEINKFIRRAHRKLGTAYRNGLAEITSYFVVEGDSVLKERHVHGLIEVPPSLNAPRFAILISECWKASLWALPIKRLEVAKNNVAWTVYMLKGGIENLDVHNTRLPVARIG